MAIVTRRYVEKGPSNADLHTYVNASANVVERFRSPVCDVEYDDVTPGIMEALDEYMDSLGYDALSGNLAVDVLDRPDNPAAVLGRVQVYSLSIGGVSTLFARQSNGTTTKLTPLQSPTGYANGCVVSYVSASVVQVSPGRVRDKVDNLDLVLGVATNINIAVAGVNGLDTGVEVANQWYYVFVIGDSTGVNPVATILSEQTGAPIYPAGYDISRRVGSVRNQASDFRDFVMNGEGSTRDVQYRDAITGHQVLTVGAAIVVTEISLVNHLPGPSRVARILCTQTGIVVGQLYFDPALSLATFQRTIGVGLQTGDMLLPTSSTRRIAYANAGVGGLLNVWVAGYQESI